MVEDHIACGGPCEVQFDVLDMEREARAWAAARNVPNAVMHDPRFTPPMSNTEPPTVTSIADSVMTEHEFLYGSIPGLQEHTEAAVRRISHNSIVTLDAREQALGDLEEALAHLFDDDDPRDLSLKLPAVRRAWRAWKDAA